MVSPLIVFQHFLLRSQDKFCTYRYSAMREAGACDDDVLLL
jgi:hypothetical protein